MRKPVIPALAVAAVAFVLLPAETAQSANEWTLGLKLRGRWIEGTPLAWSTAEVQLLARDGRLWNFAPEEAEQFRRVSNSFAGYSHREMRGRLLREFGPKFDVSGTGHYLVVHPAGRGERWADRFVDLYRSFVHYFTARGFRPSSPRFPLVAVVFSKRGDFLRYAAKEKTRVSAGVLGYYSPVTNRIAMFDVTAGGPAGGQWYINAETIIHEATHQTAFNTGLHERLTSQRTPLWVIEGLATMFEAPGVYDSLNYRERSDRVHPYRLKRFQRYLATHRTSGSLARLVSSDRVFQSDPDAAYAEAWALTFFLAETRPRQYGDYLSAAASQSAGASKSPGRRLRTFTDVFGGNLTMLDAHFVRFVKELSR